MNSEAAISYLIPPRPYLWHWAADASAAEWADGATVCVWEELHALLRYLAPHRLPPLGAVLMVLLACQGREDAAWDGALRFSAAVTGGQEPSRHPEALLRRARPALRAVAALPEELRRGTAARALLLRTLFESADSGPNAGQSAGILEAVETMGLEPWLSRTPRAHGLARLLRDLKALAAVQESGAHLGLETALRTGLDSDSVEPAPLPAPELPAEAPSDHLPLLRQLEEHPEAELTAVAAAARRMIALFSLPKTAGRGTPLPVGGISDITHRGELNRLLPAELAHDDVILMARLAGNEALYHRRDAPPEDPAAERIILLDSGVHLWGIPRVLALAAALGLKVDAPARETVTVFLRNGGRFEPLALESANDTLRALRVLHADPDPSAALAGFPLEDRATARPTVIFISVPRRDGAMRDALHGLGLRAAELGGRVFEFTITRGGNIEFSARGPAGVRRISAGKIDPDTVLRPVTSDSAQVESKPARPLISLPETIRHLAFYQQWPLPLRFPVPADLRHFQRTRSDETMIATEARRLLRLTESRGSVVEIASELPPARSRFIQNHDVSVVVVSTAAAPGGAVRATLINRTNGGRRDVTLSASHSFPTNCRILAGAAILDYGHKIEACSLENGARLDEATPPPSTPLDQVAFDGVSLEFLPGNAAAGKPPAPPEIKTHKDSLMEAPLAAGFTSSGALVLRGKSGGRELSLPELRLVPSLKKLLSGPRHFAPLPGSENTTDPANTRGFYIAEWSADCRCVHDPRGLIHLVFHDMHGPVEITLLCLTEKPMAAWVRHWPAHFAGNSEYFLEPYSASQPVVHLAPLLRRFYVLATSAAPRPASLNPSS